MNKKKLALSLLCPLLSQNNIIFSMEKIQKNQIVVYQEKPVKKLHDTTLISELQEHPLFLKMNPKKVHKTTEQFDVAINRIKYCGNLTDSILFLEEEEQPNPSPAETSQKGLGFYWYVKSFIQPSSALLHQTLDTKSFDYTNNDHLQLLNDGIMDCINKQSDEVLIEILIAAKRNYAGKITLQNETSNILNERLMSIKSKKNDAIMTDFIEDSKAKESELKTLLLQLKEHCHRTLIVTGSLLRHAIEKEETTNNYLKDVINQTQQAINCHKAIASHTFNRTNKQKTQQALISKNETREKLELALLEINSFDELIKELRSKIK